MASSTGRWLALPMLVALGCGGSSASAPAATTANEVKEPSATGPSNAITKRGSGSVAALVGSGGGTLELNEGPRVVIPRGAVTGGQDFVLKVAQKTTAFANKESEKALGPTFSFSPGIETNGEKIEVSFPLASVPAGWGDPSIAYEIEEGAAISYGEDSTRTKWQYERARLNGGRVVALLDALPGMRVQFVLTNLEAQ